MEQADGRISYWILVLCALVIRLVYYGRFRDIGRRLDNWRIYFMAEKWRARVRSSLRSEAEEIRIEWIVI